MYPFQKASSRILYLNPTFLDENLRGHLHYIREDHVDMLRLYEKIKVIVESNQTGPTTYLYPMYTFYFPILAGKMRAITEHVFSQREIPSLEVRCHCRSSTSSISPERV